MLSNKAIDLETLTEFKGKCDEAYANQKAVCPQLTAGLAMGVQVEYELLSDGTYNLVIKTTL